MATHATKLARRQPAGTQKITVEVPRELLARAQANTGAGVTETVREGLKILSAREASRRLLKMSSSGKAYFPMTWQQLKGKA